MLPSNDRIAGLAAQIDSLQRGYTSSRDERAIAQIFLSTSGTELSALKNAIDAGEDYHTLHELLHHDISDPGIRKELFDHFTAHAVPSGEVKVLSDVDDTFYENWIDKRYPKKTVFPGVRELYRELDIGAAETGSIGDLVFLTARPYDRLGITDHLTHEMLHQHGLKPSTILPGDFAHLLTNELIAEEKHKRFLEFVQLYPEYDFVFLGDSGQGDAIAGRMMLHHPAVKAVFIHDVVATPPAEREAQQALRVYFHDTYVGAAARAFSLGLISATGLRRVADAAKTALAAILFSTPEQADFMRSQFQRDLAMADSLISSGRTA